ncbi:sigma-70 family RNA polymerase sigma factor [Alloacidobacterium dinghuense]|uniref:Sigma-70 family RNA polymerase sigma factor n=1 Tax=Alloacidobacterium dinghuense TaxID=2763107 RepID=A0A7G8BL42_9BACT|nr:sigma-70 family RNA polymerase sigma factor [Alloacidobacterium dinghuense]QNI33262.1 sigma-70 family RNA polymerase sigma factor [Alloacidobacterium dinghuense]
MQAGTVVGNLAGVVVIRPDEADVVAELKAGSEEAFAWLISTYHQPIYSVIARMLQNPADAADVTQDVFIKVFRGVGGFHGESSLRTWMYRIALHEASNRRRWWSRHCRQEVTIEAETGHSADGQPLCIKDTLVDLNESPFDLAAHAEIRARVEAELREISEPFRTVLILRDIEGLAYEEIAEILNVQLGTVKSRLMRGRATIKARLAPFAEAAAKRPAGAARRPVSAVACVAKEAQ